MDLDKMDDLLDSIEETEKAYEEFKIACKNWYWEERETWYKRTCIWSFIIFCGLVILPFVLIMNQIG